MLLFLSLFYCWFILQTAYDYKLHFMFSSITLHYRLHIFNTVSATLILHILSVGLPFSFRIFINMFLWLLSHWFIHISSTLSLKLHCVINCTLYYTASRAYARFSLGGCSLTNNRWPFSSNIKYYTSVKTSIQRLPLFNG